MSTPSKIKISSSYPVSQVYAEIEWIDKEITRVTELMKRRPSKIRHLHDLERQKRDRLQILETKEHQYNKSMTMPPNDVHPNLDSAKEACRLYLEAMYELQDKFHVFETCDDSCVQTYVCARYLNEEGVIKEYTHW